MNATRKQLYTESNSRFDKDHVEVSLVNWFTDYDDILILEVRTDYSKSAPKVSRTVLAMPEHQAIRQAIARFDALVAEYSPKVEDSHDELMDTLPDDYPPYEPGALADDTEAVNAWIDGGYEEMEVTQEEDDFPW